MSGNRISIGFLSSAQIQGAMRREETPRAPFGKRVIAPVKANKFDRMLAVGVPRSRRQCTRRARGTVDIGRRARGHRPVLAACGRRRP